MIRRPRFTLLIGAVVLAALALGWAALGSSDASWAGVDDTVVLRFALPAGRAPASVLPDTDRGDLPLFFFLAAGAAGGFICGYCFRALFPPRRGAEP